jgi:uncharacterized protein (DUF433 family)
VLAGVPASTLRSWVHGRSFPVRGGVRQSAAIIRLPRSSRGFLSFTNLVEAHVLSAMRRRYELKLDAVRRAVAYLRRELGVDHPLATEKFKTDGVDLFVDRVEKLVNVTRGGQLAMRDVIDASLDRVEYDRAGRAMRLFPIVRREASNDDRYIVIDPRRAFGRPVISGTAVPVDDIAARFGEGDSIPDLARDYDVEAAMVEEALRASAKAA